MLLISTAIAVAAGCGTEMQREMISLIDEQEQAAREISEIVEENLDDFEAQLREHVELMTTQWETSDWRMWQSDMTQFNGDPDHDYELALNTQCPSNYPTTGETTPEARAHQTASEKCRCLRNIVVQYTNELADLSPEYFDGVREEIAGTSDEMLLALGAREMIQRDTAEYSVEETERRAARRREAPDGNPFGLRYCRIG